METLAGCERVWDSRDDEAKGTLTVMAEQDIDSKGEHDGILQTEQVGKETYMSLFTDR